MQHKAYMRASLKIVASAGLLVGCLLGVLPATVAIADSLGGLSVVFPLMGPKLSSTYGDRKHPVYRFVRHHNGVDLAAPASSHVRVIAKGTVLFADSYAGYGKLVTVQHPGGFTSLYGHLSAILVNPGESVEAGQVVGRVGKTGTATGNHLHFEWRQGGKSINPLKVFPSLTAAAEG